MHSHIQYRTGRTELAPTNLDVRIFNWCEKCYNEAGRLRLSHIAGDL